MNWSKERSEAMEWFAAADRSDPFTLARCKAHMRNGIAGFRQSSQWVNERGDHCTIEPMPWPSEHDGKRMSVLRQDLDAWYEATAHMEQHTLPDGREYYVTVYRNMVRP